MTRNEELSTDKKAATETSTRLKVETETLRVRLVALRDAGVKFSKSVREQIERMELCFENIPSHIPEFERTCDEFDALLALENPMDRMKTRYDSKPNAPVERLTGILVNGREVMFAHAHLFYDDAVRLARGNSHALHSVTYRLPGHGGRTGTLTPGESVEVVDGMVINAFVTSGT